ESTTENENIAETASENIENNALEAEVAENQEQQENATVHDKELEKRKQSLVEGRYSPFYNNDVSSYSSANENVTTTPNSHFGEESYKKKTSGGGLWWKSLLIIALLLLALGLVYLFVPTVKNAVNKQFSIKSTMRIDTLDANDLLKIRQLADSLANDSLAKITSDSIKATTQSAPQSPDYHKIKTTETVSTGTTLAALARKHYGHNDLWVYIYEANKNSIQNPDNLKVGTRLNIPDIDKSLIDLKNPETLRKAQELARKIRKK
ncbi:MAG: LysM peptidoglycan-binding domain-containing protein, partial [Prevotellaceae bacterium]|nr:LysM peptidoglycan-binding domain-containing protein [Prevotellaceae bacterium]